MELEKAIEVLNTHNEWRRGSDSVEMSDPKELGEAIEEVVKYYVGTNETHIKETQVSLPRLPRLGVPYPDYIYKEAQVTIPFMERLDMIKDRSVQKVLEYNQNITLSLKMLNEMDLSLCSDEEKEKHKEMVTMYRNREENYRANER